MVKFTVYDEKINRSELLSPKSINQNQNWWDDNFHVMEILHFHLSQLTDEDFKKDFLEFSFSNYIFFTAEQQ